MWWLGSRLPLSMSSASIDIGPRSRSWVTEPRRSTHPAGRRVSSSHSETDKLILSYSATLLAQVLFISIGFQLTNNYKTKNESIFSIILTLIAIYWLQQWTATRFWWYWPGGAAVSWTHWTAPVLHCHWVSCVAQPSVDPCQCPACDPVSQSQRPVTSLTCPWPLYTGTHHHHQHYHHHQLYFTFQSVFICLLKSSIYRVSSNHGRTRDTCFVNSLRLFWQKIVKVIIWLCSEYGRRITVNCHHSQMASVMWSMSVAR